MQEAKAITGVRICYPTSGTGVPGSGGFYTWIKTPTGVTVTVCKLTWQDGMGGTKTQDGVVVPNAPSPVSFAFSFHDIPLGAGVNLYVQGSDASSDTRSFMIAGF